MDVFVYDIITITIDKPCYVERAKDASLLIVHIIFRPWHSDEPLKLDDPLSLRKLTGEGQIDESKTCLGWYIQTRSIQLFLLG